MSHIYQGPGAYPIRNVANAAPGCERQGCQISQAQGLLNAARQIIKETRRENMSQAMWCDAGGHAFSERDPGRQRISITVLDEETEQERQESRDFCGDCAQKAGLLNKRRTRPAAPPAISPVVAEPRKADPEHIAQLEDELGMPRSGTGASGGY